MWSIGSGRFTLAESAYHSSTYVSSRVEGRAPCTRARACHITQRTVVVSKTNARTCGPTPSVSHGTGCTPSSSRASTRSRGTVSVDPLLGSSRPSRYVALSVTLSRLTPAWTPNVGPPNDPASAPPSFDPYRTSAPSARALLRREPRGQHGEAGDGDHESLHWAPSSTTLAAPARTISRTSARAC